MHIQVCEEKIMKKKLSVFVSALLMLSMLMCMMPFAFAEDDSAPFRISVAMNGDASTQRGFCWYTKTETDSLIEISSSAAVAASEPEIVYDDVFEWEGNYCHKALVSGLEPGTAYTYTVGSKDVRSAEGTFVTDDGDEAFSFLAIADVQASSAENFEKGADTLKAGFEMFPESEFYVNCGDFTNDSTNEEWDYYADSFDVINQSSTIVPVAGNHDGLGVWDWFANMFNTDTSEAVQTLNGMNYSFDYGNAHIAVINTNDMLSTSLSQLDWLKKDMNSTDKDWKIVCMHKSPYTLGKDGKWPDALYLQESLASVLDSCDVDLVLSGHDHQYVRTKKLTNNKPSDDGVTYVLVGTAGSKRYEVREFMADAFLDNDNIAALTIQKNGYGNYWNGTDWESTKEENIGGCFNSISIEGGTLTFNSYILSDELTNDNGDRLITNIDSFTLTKETGKGKATYTGDNTTSEAEYVLGAVPSFISLAVYTFTNWLPRFLWIVPKMIVALINGASF